MKKIKIFLLIVLVLGIGFIIYLKSTSGEYYKTFSPDNQYSVYASQYNWENFINRFPSGGSDASGVVYLYDEIEDKIINKAHIGMLWLTPEINWTKNTAYFTGDEHPNIIKPWKLPRPILKNKIE